MKVTAEALEMFELCASISPSFDFDIIDRLQEGKLKAADIALPGNLVTNESGVLIGSNFY